MDSLLLGFGQVLHGALTVFSWIVLARIVMSWVSADMRNPVVLLLSRLTDPFLRRIAALFPRLGNIGGFDFTPMVLFLIIILVQRFIADPLIRLGLTP